jgi:hypothetical protein
LGYCIYHYYSGTVKGLRRGFLFFGSFILAVVYYTPALLAVKVAGAELVYSFGQAVNVEDA